MRVQNCQPVSFNCYIYFAGNHISCAAQRFHQRIVQALQLFRGILRKTSTVGCFHPGDVALYVNISQTSQPGRKALGLCFWFVRSCHRRAFIFATEPPFGDGEVAVSALFSVTVQVQHQHSTPTVRIREWKLCYSTGSDWLKPFLSR